jgi:hypothetical protein
MPLSVGSTAEIFLPLSGAVELNKSPAALSYLQTLEDALPFWTSTVATYEQKIHSDAEDAKTREKVLTDTIERLRGGAQDSNLRERFFRQHSNTWAKQTKSFPVKRDAQLNSSPSTSFPQGESIRSGFATSFVQFETFAADVVTCLEELGHSDPTAVLVRDVMMPLFLATERFVKERLDAKRTLLWEAFGTTLDEHSNEDSAVRLFWYYTQQRQLTAEVESLREDAVNSLVAGAHPLLPQLELQMYKAALTGVISAEEQNLRVPKLVRHLLRLQVVTTLSDPRCYLHPAPGTRVQYKEGHCVEILSPGTMRHGRIKEGDQVEVVLCGLYFDTPSATTKPTFPCLVRRLA